MADDQNAPKPLNRSELYDLAWTEPMRDIAKRYGISDVGLAKLCRRFEIATPKAGYWMKAQHGKKVRQTPLPSAKVGDEVEVLAPRTREVIERPPLPDDIAAAIEAISGETISYPRLPSPHSIIEGWNQRAIAAERRFNPYRVMAPRMEPIERRRRRFLTLLFREIERPGGKISAEDHSKFEATIAGEVVKFSVRERYKQERRETTEEEKRRSYYGNQQYVTESKPTGTLKLELDPWMIRWAKKRFDDKESLPLEDQLSAILTNLYIAAADVRRWRLEREEEERRRWQRQQEEWAAEERRKAEVQKVADLERSATLWGRAQSIRTFVTAAMLSGHYTDEWASWARSVADEMDPLTGSR